MLENSQYTYIYETLDHEGLVRYARDNFGIDGHESSTQAILAKIFLAKRDHATHVGSPRQPVSVSSILSITVVNCTNNTDYQIQALPGAPLQVGGGWHKEFAASQPKYSQGKKQGQGTSNAPGASTKRPRINPVVENDTATESEMEDEWSRNPVRTVAEQLLSGVPKASNNHNPRPASFAHNTHPPRPSPNDHPVSRQSTATTVPATQPPCSLVGVSSHSHYGGSVTPTSPIPPIPNLLSPTSGPVHGHLRRKALQRYMDCVDRNAETAATEASDEEVDELMPTDADEAPATEPNTSLGVRYGVPQKASSGPFAPGTASQRTYTKTRTHIPSQYQTHSSEPKRRAGPEREREDSPDPSRLTSAARIRKEGTLALAAKVQAESEGLLKQRQRSLLVKQATKPPTTRSQPRPQPNANRDPPGMRARVTRRVDPVGAAQADMTRFNEACAREQATSFVQSVTRQSKRTARCIAPSSRPLTGYLDDDEELLAQAEAYSKRKWPVSFIS